MPKPADYLAPDNYVLRETAAQVAELCLAAGRAQMIPQFLRHRPYLQLAQQDLEQLAHEEKPVAVASRPAPSDDWTAARAANAERLAQSNGSR